MIWISAFALVLGLIFAALRTRWPRSAATETEQAPVLQEPDFLGERRRSKYKVTSLQSGLDQDPED